MIDKNKYGIIYTPGFFVEKMLNLIPEIHFSNPDLKWLDVGAGNGIFGVKIGSTIYSCNFLIASKAQTMTCNFAMVFGSGLSNVTVAAWIAAPNTVTRTMYHHDYNSWYTGVWSMTVQEIQQ